MERPDGTTHFGFRDVELGEKQTLVNEVFHSVAKRYDLMNDLMSGGMHRLWKEAMITALNPPRSDAPFALLDVAGGTGDISFRAAKAAGHGFQATVCDINGEMLAVGRERAAAQHLDHQVSFVEGNAEALAFPDRSFDAYTIAFGIRNVPRIPTALGEAYRVLKKVARRALAFGKHHAKRPRHAEMHQQHVAAVHVGHQVFRTPAEAADHLTFEARSKILLERKAQAITARLDTRDPLPLHHRLQAAPDGFNLG